MYFLGELLKLGSKLAKLRYKESGVKRFRTERIIRVTKGWGVTHMLGNSPPPPLPLMIQTTVIASARGRWVGGGLMKKAVKMKRTLEYLNQK